MKNRLLLALVAGGALASAASAQSFSYPDFSNWTGISPVGLTTQAGSILRLQDNVAPTAGGDNRGAAWYDTAVNVKSGFDTTFVYRMHTPSTTGGSDGLAFVIHNDQVAGFPMTTGYPDGTGNTALGRHAAACGFGLFATSNPGESVDNALAIHLDTYSNGTWGDLNANHISIHTGGNADNSQDESYSLGRANPTTNLNDAAEHTVRVVYVPGTLEVYLDGNLELSVAYDFTTGSNCVDSGTPVGGLDLVGGSAAYVGFTSGAGSAREFRDVISWEWTSLGGPGTGYCFGDGTGSPCPCGNDGAADTGCANGSGSGAALTASGTSSVAADDLVLEATNALPSQPGLFFQGDAALNGGLGLIFGDGLRCAGSNVIRLQTVFPDGSGAAQSSVGIAALTGLSAGDTKFYQFWYRDPLTSPCGSLFNLTNGYELTWGL